MHAIRSLIDRRPLAALLCAAALLLKLLIPGGYMIGTDRGRVTIELCSGIAGQQMATMAMPMAGTHGHDGDHGKPETPCAYAGLATAALGAVDPVLLHDQIAFIEAGGLAPVVARAIVAAAHLRPPLRGPPATG